jgi:polysaccharide pyruvyl transferase WcaK-like protein
MGAYGGVNIGDEMILRAAVKLARASGENEEINVIGPERPQYPAAIQDYEELGLRFASWHNPVAAVRAVAGRDLFIGGGQLIDGVAWLQYPVLKLALALIVRLTGGRVTIGGVSTAHLDSAAVRQAYDKLFRLTDRIVTRDRWSLRDVLEITPSAALKAHAKADLVFSLRDEFGGGPPVEQRTTIAFAVHGIPWAPLTDFSTAIEFLRRAERLLAPGHEISIVAHDRRPQWDLGLANRLATELSSDRVSVRAFATVEDCIAFYRTARSVVSSRMHPIILGACAGAYCIPLSGSRKIEDMAGRLGVPLTTLSDLAQLTDEVFSMTIGIAGGGPLADENELTRLSAEARRVL